MSPNKFTEVMPKISMSLSWLSVIIAAEPIKLQSVVSVETHQPWATLQYTQYGWIALY